MTRHGIWLLWLLCLPVWGQGWQLQTGEAGILLWTRAHPPGAFLALRLEMNVAAPPSALLAVLHDTARHQEWLPQSLEVRVLAKPAPDEDLVYTRLSAPWPVQERELITHSRLRRNADCSLQLTVWAAPDALPPYPGRVRIQASEGRWEALPQLNGTTLVRLETYTNPGDSLPSWLINPIATQAALDSFRAIRRLMEAMPPQPCACARQHQAGKWHSCQVIP
ncbi:START domain-containing protein [Aeromonas piscicola]|uniref:START domain-containing protein n=1 Tax=Aeromonas piscicola TaxID=600645 RepID=UPI0028E3870B|nr:START domain-containing protein [Aeromonas piscicola]